MSFTGINRQTRLILIGAAVLLSLGMGLRQSLGLFLTPVTRDLALTAADFTLAVAVQNIVWGLSQAPVGAIADRFGLRITMMAGAVIYVVGLGGDGDGRRRAGADRLRRADRHRAVVHRLVAGDDRGRARRIRGAPQQDARHRLGRRVARHADGAARPRRALLANHAWQIGALFFRGAGGGDAAGRRFSPAAPTGCRGRGGAQDDDARRCSARRCAIGRSW